MITKYDLEITKTEFKKRLKKQQRERINKHKKSKHRYNLLEAHNTIAKYKTIHSINDDYKILHIS